MRAYEKKRVRVRGMGGSEGLCEGKRGRRKDDVYLYRS